MILFSVNLYDTNNRKVAFIAEVKNRKSKVGSTDVKKFIATILLAQKKHKIKRTIGMYISKSGFTKPAQKLLQTHGILFSTSVEKFLS